MSKEYKQQTANGYKKKAKELLSQAPPYLHQFYEYLGGRAAATQTSYLRDVLSYIKYLIKSIPRYRNVPLHTFPVSVFDHQTLDDLVEYQKYLQDATGISNAAVKKQMSALSVFYKYLNISGFTSNNPFRYYDMPAVNSRRIIKLDSQLSKELLAGILRNDRYLAETKDGMKPLPIPKHVWVRRERLVLRNYAICAAFLGTGLRVSELVGLDVSDISFRQNSLNIIKKGSMDETRVYFNEEVASALRTYIEGTPLPSDLLDKYLFREEPVYNWCKEHLLDADLDAHAKQKFKGRDASFYSDIQALSAAMRRQGRASLLPAKNEKAVFLSMRGKRMTVRMVELMIKEMVQTYLPEYEDKDLFTPHKLRATCATRILTQTGDIQLAAVQLNHKGVAVTAEFYAELQKEQQKEKIQNLDLSDW